MQISEEILISASPAKVWKVISDIDGSVQTISGIDEIEVLDRPKSGIVGLKWRETRTLFGRQATEVMWITEAQENDYYQTRSGNSGVVYISRLELEKAGKKTKLRMRFAGEQTSLLAKVMAAITTPFFKKATIEAVRQDLEDIKIASEN